MLRKSDWLIDPRPIKSFRTHGIEEIPWEEWLENHRRGKELWLFAIIELLMKNNDWAGAYLLVQTHISTCKQAEGTGFHNRTPFDESAHIRAVRRWFWSMVEEYGFVLPEEEIPYEKQNIDSRRSVDHAAAKAYPFVGGKPKRRYSEAVDFFEQVEADRKLNRKMYRPPDTPREKKEYLETQAAKRAAERVAAGKKPMGWPKGKLRKPKPETGV